MTLDQITLLFHHAIFPRSGALLILVLGLRLPAKDKNNRGCFAEDRRNSVWVLKGDQVVRLFLIRAAPLWLYLIHCEFDQQLVNLNKILSEWMVFTDCCITPIAGYPEMRPGLYFPVEGIPRAGGVDQLTVAVHDVTRRQVAVAHSACGQPLSHQLQGALRWQAAGKVADYGNAIALRVVAQGVGTLPRPATALVDVAIRSGHKAGVQRATCGAQGCWGRFTLKLHICAAFISI